VCVCVIVRQRVRGERLIQGVIVRQRERGRDRLTEREREIDTNRERGTD
jgi:hypothetical protein